MLRQIVKLLVIDMKEISEARTDKGMINNTAFYCDLYVSNDQRGGSHAGISSPYTTTQMCGL